MQHCERIIGLRQRICNRGRKRTENVQVLEKNVIRWEGNVHALYMGEIKENRGHG
jgi:hypothetical protein